MADLLLKNIHALFQCEGTEQRDVDLRISGNQIAEIGHGLKASPETRVLDCTNKVVLPGLINTHHHFFQTMTRCLPGAQDEKLFEWLVYHYQVWRHVRPETLHAAARLAIAELQITGCTTSSDHHYLFPQGVADDLIGIEIEAARELGMRFCATRGSMTLGQSGGGLPPDDLVEDDDHVLRSSEDLIRKYHDPSPLSMCRLNLAPCSPFNVTPHLLKESAELARKHHVRLHTHLAETKDEEEYCIAKYGVRPLQFMDDLGWIGADIWYAHGIHFNDDELDKLAKRGTGVAHCPSSNMRLGSGAARIPEMITRGVPVGLAVDGSASNDSSDMLGELRQAMLLGRAVWGNRALTARKVIHLATAGSARVLGFCEAGRLLEGKAADVAIFDLDQLAFAGAFDPIAAPVFCGFDHRARAVITNGEIVVEDGRLVKGDEIAIKRNAQREATALWQRAGVV